ncbi:MAG: ParB/RepB/Spo0J family partition protein [Coraliomargarita sp.]
MKSDDTIIMVPVDQIHILNPRSRESKRYQSIISSITNLGLKTPIVVSRRSNDVDDNGTEYDLVCGQGRLEAFRAAGEEQIPARVIDVSKDDRLLMSLIENIARRQVKRSELANEIIRLEEQGYTTHQISKKIDSNFEFVQGVIKLHRSSEERLLEAVMNEKVSVSVANMIADATDNKDAQEAIMQAYESKDIPARSLTTVKRLLDQREYLGKTLKRSGTRNRSTNKETLVAAYRREVDRQKRMARKARLCETRLVFAREAFSRLFKDENFMTLLRAENMDTVPEPLAHLIAGKNGK